MDYPDSAYDSSNPSGYLSASNGRLGSSSESDHYHDRRGRRGRRAVYQAYDPLLAVMIMTMNMIVTSIIRLRRVLFHRRHPLPLPLLLRSVVVKHVRLLIVMIVTRIVSLTVILEEPMMHVALLMSFVIFLQSYREQYVNQDTQDKLGSEYRNEGAPDIQTW